MKTKIKILRLAVLTGSMLIVLGVNGCKTTNPPHGPTPPPSPTPDPKDGPVRAQMTTNPPH